MATWTVVASKGYRLMNQGLMCWASVFTINRIGPHWYIVPGWETGKRAQLCPPVLAHTHSRLRVHLLTKFVSLAATKRWFNLEKHSSWEVDRSLLLIGKIKVKQRHEMQVFHELSNQNWGEILSLGSCFPGAKASGCCSHCEHWVSWRHLHSGHFTF